MIATCEGTLVDHAVIAALRLGWSALVRSRLVPALMAYRRKRLHAPRRNDRSLPGHRPPL